MVGTLPFEMWNAASEHSPPYSLGQLVRIPELNQTMELNDVDCYRTWTAFISNHHEQVTAPFNSAIGLRMRECCQWGCPIRDSDVNSLSVSPSQEIDSLCELSASHSSDLPATYTAVYGEVYGVYLFEIAEKSR